MIDAQTHRSLVQWACWARGPYGLFDVRAESAESRYIAPAGEVWMTAEEALKQSISRSERFSDQQAIMVEQIVCKLPENPRDGLRLHYVIAKRLPLDSKCRRLGVSRDGYFELVEIAAGMVRNLLTRHEKGG